MVFHYVLMNTEVSLTNGALTRAFSERSGMLESNILHRTNVGGQVYPASLSLISEQWSGFQVEGIP